MSANRNSLPNPQLPSPQPRANPRLSSAAPLTLAKRARQARICFASVCFPSQTRTATVAARPPRRSQLRFAVPARIAPQGEVTRERRSDICHPHRTRRTIRPAFFLVTTCAWLVPALRKKRATPEPVWPATPPGLRFNPSHTLAGSIPNTRRSMDTQRQTFLRTY